MKKPSKGRGLVLALAVAFLLVAGYLILQELRSHRIPARYFYLREGIIRSEDAESARAALPFERIAMERTSCFGTCPVYTVVFHRSGLVEYSGKQHVERLGRWTGRLGVLELGRLSYLIEHERVDRPKHYSLGTDDVPSVILRLWRVGENTPIVVQDEGDVGPIGLWAVSTVIDAMLVEITWTRAP